MTDTPRLGNEFLDPGSLQIDVPFNDLLQWLDANVNLDVVSATTTAQPGSPSDGQAYILPSGKTGTQWGGFTAGQIAYYYSGAWTAYTVKAGTLARAADTGELHFSTASNTWRTLSALLGSKGTDLASAATVDLGAATGDYVHITGTTTITAFGTAKAGLRRDVVFDGILTLTHNATSLILPTAANITTAAGDRAVFRSLGSGNWRCMGYQRADGTPLALQVDAMQYKGSWNANTNTPTLADGTGNTGDVYKVGTEGTQDLGGGSRTYYVGDQLIYNGATWDYIPSANQLDSADVVAALGYTPARTYGTVTALGNISGAVDIDLSAGPVYTGTLTGNVTLTFTNPPSAGFAAEVVLIFVQDGTGGRTITWPAGTKWPNGIAHVMTATADAEDHIGVRIRDAGSTIRAYPVENFG